MPRAVKSDSDVYIFPLYPGTAAWANASVLDRNAACNITKDYRDNASTLGLIRTIATHPRIRSAEAGSGTIAASYNAMKTGSFPILIDVERSDFGVAMVTFFASLDPQSISNTYADNFTSLCWIEYKVISYMASLDSCLDTMPVSSRQLQFKRAIYDGHFWGTIGDYKPASAAARLAFTIYAKPDSYRGTLPANLLTPLTSDQTTILEQNQIPAEVLSQIMNAYSVLGLTSRP